MVGLLCQIEYESVSCSLLSVFTHAKAAGLIKSTQNSLFHLIYLNKKQDIQQVFFLMGTFIENHALKHLTFFFVDF